MSYNLKLMISNKGLYDGLLPWKQDVTKQLGD